MQFELDAYHFYRMGMERTSDTQMRVVLEEMYKKEMEESCPDIQGSLRTVYAYVDDPNMVHWKRRERLLFM